MTEGPAPRGRVFSRSPSALRSFQGDLFERFMAGDIVLPQKKYSAVSTFSSAGIGDYGYRLAGFSFKVHAEMVPERLAICKLNHPRTLTIEGDLRKSWHEVVDGYRDRVGRKVPDLLAGMSPCQGMSPSTLSERQGRTKWISKDSRNTLPFVLVKIVRELRPLSIVVENVPGIVTTRVREPDTGEVGTVASLLAKKLDAYVCYPITLQFADYGVPQRRQRTLLTFIRKDQRCIAALRKAQTIPYPGKTHDRSARFGRLSWVPARDFLGPPRFRPLTSYSPGRARDLDDPLHYVPVYESRHFELIRGIPPFSGRSAYQNDVCPSCGVHNVPEDIATCDSCESPLINRPIVMEPNGPRLIIGHETSYKRMPANLPVGTVTTANGHLGSDAKIHPWENRLLSPRECACAQTIPMSFRFGERQNGSHTRVLRQTIGEAIPPWFTFLHGLVLRNLLGSGNAVKHLLSAQDYDVENLHVSSVEEREVIRRRSRDRFSSLTGRSPAPIAAS